MKRRTLCSWAAGSMLAQLSSARGAQSAAKAGKPPDTLPGAEKNRKLKVVFVGAHVDDWGVCNGTLARYGRDGHDVLCLSLTPGDSIMMSKRLKMPLEELCAARQEQAIRGTKIIGARFRALKSQSNQKMRVDAEAYLDFNKTLAAENPDVVFGMWPIEFHPDHRAAANLAFNAWLQSGMKFDFYFSETGEANEMTSQLFVPNRWVDITSVYELKHQSFMANTFINTGWHNAELWTKFRGAEYGCQYAEAFVRVHTVGSVGMPEDPKPGLWWQGLHPARD